MEQRALKTLATRALLREEFQLFKDQLLRDQQELKQRVDLCLSGAFCSSHYRRRLT